MRPYILEIIVFVLTILGSVGHTFKALGMAKRTGEPFGHTFFIAQLPNKGGSQ